MSGDRKRRATEAFFGRRRGKALRPAQRRSLQAAEEGRLIGLGAPAPREVRSLFDGAVSSVRLEIGFGGGEHLFHEASRFAGTGFIGVEPFVNGFAKLAALLDEEPLANIRLYNDDATRLLDWLPASCLGGIDLLYPDPWPKRRHWKRRFVNPANLDRFARVMKAGALFRFASDIDTYVCWTLLHCRRHPAFEWLAEGPGDWRVPYEGWPGTRYEAKAVREGRTPAYLTFRRL